MNATKEQNNHIRKCPKEQKELVGERHVWRIDIKIIKKLNYIHHLQLLLNGFLI